MSYHEPTIKGNTSETPTAGSERDGTSSANEGSGGGIVQDGRLRRMGSSSSSFAGTGSVNHSDVPIRQRRYTMSTPIPSKAVQEGAPRHIPVCGQQHPPTRKRSMSHLSGQHTNVRVEDVEDRERSFTHSSSLKPPRGKVSFTSKQGVIRKHRATRSMPSVVDLFNLTQEQAPTLKTRAPTTDSMSAQPTLLQDPALELSRPSPHPPPQPPPGGGDGGNLRVDRKDHLCSRYGSPHPPTGRDDGEQLLGLLGSSDTQGSQESLGLGVLSEHYGVVPKQNNAFETNVDILDSGNRRQSLKLNPEFPSSELLADLQENRARCMGSEEEPVVGGEGGGVGGGTQDGHGVGWEDSDSNIVKERSQPPNSPGKRLRKHLSTVETSRNVPNDRFSCNTNDEGKDTEESPKGYRSPSSLSPVPDQCSAPLDCIPPLSKPSPPLPSQQHGDNHHSHGPSTLSSVFAPVEDSDGSGGTDRISMQEEEPWPDRQRGLAFATCISSGVSSSREGMLDLAAAVDRKRKGLIRRNKNYMNAAKQIANQKRGVTNSYKTEGSYTKYKKIVSFLVLLGIITGLGSRGIDRAIVEMQALRSWATEEENTLGLTYSVRFVLFWLYMVAGVCLASLVTARYAPDIAGSGIPVMKYMMDTDEVAKKLDHKFTFSALLLKPAALVVASGCGLNVGREGPYVHTSGMAAYQLMKHSPVFRDILERETVLRQVLAASVAVGVSSTFASTIGGVLFSIEVTTMFYDVGNYFKAFAAAVSGAVAVSLVKLLEGGSLSVSNSVSFDESPLAYEVWHYPIFFALGVLFGFLGPVYVNFRLYLLRLCRRWGRWEVRKNKDKQAVFLLSSVMVAGVVGTVTAILSFFPGEYNRSGAFKAFQDLVSPGDLPSTWSNESSGGIWVSLPLAVVTRFIMSALGTSIVVPAGDFIQTSLIGAALGRLVGEACKIMAPEHVDPSTFALVAAAGMTAGCTQTISVAVVLMELTGSFSLELPVVLTCVVAFGLSRRFGHNIYDSVMAENDLQSLYGLDIHREHMVASDIMEKSVSTVPCLTTVGELLSILEMKQFESYPVVNNSKDLVFLGTVARKELVFVILNGGNNAFHNPDFMNYVISRLPNEDVASGWEKLGKVMAADEHMDLYGNLPRDVVKLVMGEHNNQKTLKAIRNGLTSTLERIQRVSARSISNLRSSTDLMGQSGGERGSGEEGCNGRTSTFNLAGLVKAKFNADSYEDPFNDRPVDLLKLSEKLEGDIHIDQTAWKAQESMPLRHVYLLFANLRCIRLFIVTGDKLSGVISRPILFKALSKRKDHHRNSGRRNLSFTCSNSASNGCNGNGNGLGRPRVSSFSETPRRWYNILLGQQEPHCSAL